MPKPGLFKLLFRLAVYIELEAMFRLLLIEPLLKLFIMKLFDACVLCIDETDEVATRDRFEFPPPLRLFSS